MEQLCRRCSYHYEGNQIKKICPYCGEATIVMVAEAEELVEN